MSRASGGQMGWDEGGAWKVDLSGSCICHMCMHTPVQMVMFAPYSGMNGHEQAYLLNISSLKQNTDVH